MKIYTITRLDDQLYGAFWKQSSDEFRNLLKQQFRNQLSRQINGQLDNQLYNEIKGFQHATGN